MFRRSKLPPEPTLDAIKKTARILIVDDQTWPYQSNLDNEGYHVEHRPEIERLSDLESGHYSLILLDVHGVGAPLGEGTDGLDILYHVKSKDPLIPIILYSSKSLDTGKIEKAKLADSVRKKKDSFTEFKQDIDRLLLDSASPGRYLAAVYRTLGSRAIDLPDLTSKYRRSIARNDVSISERYLVRQDVDRETVRDVVQLIQLALTVVSAT